MRIVSLVWLFICLDRDISFISTKVGLICFLQESKNVVVHAHDIYFFIFSTALENLAQPFLRQ